MLINKENKNVGDLFNVKYKIYNYLNQKGNIIKTICKPIEKKFIKQISKKEYDGKFQKNCEKIVKTTGIITIALYLGTLALVPICPSFSLLYLFFGTWGTSSSIFIGTAAAYNIRDAIEYYSNKEFNEQKVIKELDIEED